jgi:hypothetical protein
VLEVSVRVCVYSAIYGGYDVLKSQPEQTIECDFVCFTDAAGPARVAGWHMIRVDRSRHMHPRMRAKFFKINSHKVFPKGRLAWRYDPLASFLGRNQFYDAIVWIDGSIQIKSAKFIEEFVAHIGPNGWTMFVHPDRDCIYNELIASLSLRKYQAQPVEAQVNAYRREGYPAGNGLMACTVIGRSSQDDRLARVNRAWWHENRIWSYQDQLSLPVVLWRLGLGYDPVHVNLWNNEWFDWVPHTSVL